MKIRRIITVLLAMLMLVSAFSFASSAATSKKLGDVNGDGRINIMDYAKVKSYCMKLGTLTADQLDRADIDRNGRVNIMDYSRIKSHCMGLSTIVDPEENKSPIEKIVSKTGKNGSISLDFEGTISGQKGDATVSFVSKNGVLSLQGSAVTDKGIEVNITIPLSKIATTYTFSGTAKMQAINGTCNGSMVAKDYSIDIGYFENIEFTATVPLKQPMKDMLNDACKDAMDQFLYQANILLANEKTGVTIGDLGFTNYLYEINEGWVEF